MDSGSLLPANPDILDGVDDLMQLSYLNEPSVLYNLQYRYNRDVIYVSVLYYGFYFEFAPQFSSLPVSSCASNFVSVLDKSRACVGCY